MKYLIKNYSLIFSLLISLLFIAACEDDSDRISFTPEITLVSATVDENGQAVPITPTTQGYAGNTYIIQGKGFSTLQHIYFNDTESTFNPNFVTDNNIIVTINQNTPYANASNKIKLVTKYGTLEYDFVVAPPAPVFTSYDPINAKAGETITLYGNFFLNPVVKVGDATATILSSSLTEIKAVLPANSDDKRVSVTTISGTTTASQPVGSALYDDILQGDTGHWSWSSTPIITDYTADKFQGEKSMKIAFGGWDGADFKFASRDVSKYKAFRIRLKSTIDNSDASLKLVFGGWAFQIIKKIGTDWTYIEIPFSDIGNPTTFDQITFQESGSFGGNTILIDDMGFVLK